MELVVVGGVGWGFVVCVFLGVGGLGFGGGVFLWLGVVGIMGFLVFEFSDCCFDSLYF